MGDRKAKYWFLVKSEDDTFISRIVYADSESEVKAISGVLFSPCKVYQLTCGKLWELTGCIIPPGVSDADLAKGDLYFEHKKTMFKFVF